jgi:L-alanine-DL-glutamate epimerase-like enolase superfamily enzyme
MPKICLNRIAPHHLHSRVEVFQVDLVPFSKQETPMVRVWTDDGADGTGYSYTIGTGGSAVIAMLRDYMAPWRLGRDAEMVEEIWKGLFFLTHANSVGATASLALAAVDIALWDLRCKRARSRPSTTAWSVTKKWSNTRRICSA